MNADGYRSYVVRVRRRLGAGSGPSAATRLEVEDLLDGARASLSGEPAALFADSLQQLIDTPSQPANVSGPTRRSGAGLRAPKEDRDAQAS